MLGLRNRGRDWGSDGHATKGPECGSDPVGPSDWVAGELGKAATFGQTFETFATFRRDGLSLSQDCSG